MSRKRMWEQTDDGDFLIEGYVMVRQIGCKYIQGHCYPTYALYKYEDNNPSYLPNPAIYTGTFTGCDMAYRTEIANLR